MSNLLDKIFNKFNNKKYKKKKIYKTSWMMYKSRMRMNYKNAKNIVIN